MTRLESRVLANDRGRTLERLGDRLLGRLLPRATAGAANCGTCWFAVRCRDGFLARLYTCLRRNVGGPHRRIYRTDPGLS
jgi:hypothetical protein